MTNPRTGDGAGVPEHVCQQLDSAQDTAEATPSSAPQTANQPEPHRTTRPVPVARAVGLAPSAGRTHWAWVVARCPYCGGSHLHRGGPQGGLRRAGCGAGIYQVTAGRRWSS